MPSSSSRPGRLSYLPKCWSRERLKPVEKLPPSLFLVVPTKCWTSCRSPWFSAAIRLSPSARERLLGITVGPILAAAVVADVGLSAVADTVTLPLVIGMRQNKNGSNESRDAAGSTTGSPQGNP
jgi:hypothetical protein